MFDLFHGLLFLVLVSIIDGLNTGQLNQECTTPDHQNGQCVPIRDCYTLLLGIVSKNATSIEFARKSQCGYHNGKPLVCCDEKQIADFSKYEKLLPQTDLCGQSTSDRIFNGVITQLDEYRWSVALQHKKKATGENAAVRCTGSLINKRYVLTTASCLSDDEFELTNVRLGDWDINVDPDCEEFMPEDKICADPVKSIKINKEVKHPNYNGDVTENNIGLIKLEEEAIYTDFIRPVCLPHSKIMDDLLENSTVVLSGWGTLKNDEKSSRLHHQHVFKITNEECNELIHDSKQLGDSAFCVFSHRSYFQSCLVNKGSPVMKRKGGHFNFYQMGIVTWTKECGADYPIVYTNVLYFMPWIMDTISEE